MPRDGERTLVASVRHAQGGLTLRADHVLGAHEPVDLTGIDLVIFDKDGTLLDFHAMWGGWTRELGDRLEAAARRVLVLVHVRRS